jgi:hypothetical protein
VFHIPSGEVVQNLERGTYTRFAGER